LICPGRPGFVESACWAGTADEEDLEAALL
jgi:hypothetical protein